MDIAEAGYELMGQSVKTVNNLGQYESGKVQEINCTIKWSATNSIWMVCAIFMPNGFVYSFGEASEEKANVMVKLCKVYATICGLELEIAEEDS